MKKYLSVVVVLVAVLGIFGCKGVVKEKETGKMEPVKPYEAKDYSHLIGMPGFSETALRVHFALYQGYVKNTNKLLDEMKSLLDGGQGNSPQFAELKRRFGFEFNGMKFHELYFENLGGVPGETLNSQSGLYKAIVENFGSFENWKRDFSATASARGIGWVVLYYDPSSGRLMNAWINEHHVGLLSGCKPILVMDVFEHAYMVDYQTDKTSYIDAFFNNINWKVVEARFKEK